MKQYIILLFVLCGTMLHAQIITVLDKSSRRPVASVQVTAGTNFMQATNAEGKVSLEGVEPGSMVYFSSIGYFPVSVTFDSLQVNPVVLLSLKSYHMDEVVISASRFEETKRDVAQKIAILTKTEIDFANQRSTADLLQESGEVFVQRSQFGGGSPVIRGFEASRVLLVVDGVRMNNAIYRSGHLQNIITMDQGMLDRVEIAYGPGSVVYGSDALGGVVHFYTRNPHFSTGDSLLTEVAAFTRYGSVASEKTGHLDVNIGGRRLASLTSFTYSDFGDLRTGSVQNPFYGGFGFRPTYADRINGVDTVIVNPDSTLQVGSAYSQADFMQKLSFKQSDYVLHKLNFQLSTSSDVPRYDRLTETGTGGSGLRFAEWYYGPQNRMMAAYQLNYSRATKMFDQLRFLASYQDIEESRNDRRFGADNLRSRLEQVQVIGVNADFEKGIERHEIRYGLEAYFNDVQSTAQSTNINTGATEPLDTRYPDGGSQMNAYSAYFTHTWEANEKWVINDGIRLNATTLSCLFSDTTFFPFPYSSIEQQYSAITGSLGVIYFPSESWRLSLLGSTGYRTPNVDDVSKVFDSQPGRVVVPNPDLLPEYTYNADFSISYFVEDKAQLDITAWATSFENALTTNTGTFNGQDSIIYNGELSEVVQLTNAGSAYLYGVSASLKTDLNAIVSLASGITYSYGRVRTDSVNYPLDHIPPVFGKTSLHLHLNKFRSEFYVLYNGWKRIEDYNLVGGEDNVQYATAFGMPAWYTLNIKASYSLTDFLTVQGGIDNITDLQYRVFASGISAPGRNIYLTLRAYL